MSKQSIFLLNKDQLKSFLTSNNEKPYRYKQILEWLLIKNVDSFEEMSSLSKNLRNLLTGSFVINKPSILKRCDSSDGTKKYIIKLPKDINSNHHNEVCDYIETVMIPNDLADSNHNTLCISTQVGCAMRCKFCATGKQGFSRNLSFFEIVWQLILVQQDLKIRISNIVVMGQGEPFLNFTNVIDALDCINDKKFFGIGSRKITVSTSGIINGINAFSKVNKQYTLAISLHSAIQNSRDNIMPGVKKQKLDKLKNTLLNYTKETNRRVTFEYILIEGINDDEKHLKALIEYSKDILCHINLLKLNRVKGSPFFSPNNKSFQKWINTLCLNNITTTLRSSRGEDVDAACGQLLVDLM